METMTVKEFRDGLRPSVELAMRATGITPEVIACSSLTGSMAWLNAYDGVAADIGATIEKETGLCAPLARMLARQAVNDVMLRWSGKAPS